MMKMTTMCIAITIIILDTLDHSQLSVAGVRVPITGIPETF
uniref:Uncharacterized protein n=1 Tax=Anguilla anguilla TaxID=7936 RepID=A0A0E9PKX1_ANGAN